MNKLTDAQNETCIYTGVFGAMLSATCLIQHMIFMRDHWLAYSMLGLYSFALLAFILLATRQWYAPILLIVSSGLMFIAALLLILGGIFSLVVILLLLYHAVIIAVLYIGGYPALMKQQALAAKAEESEWRSRMDEKYK